MSKQQKLAQQPCENIAKKQNMLAQPSLVIIEGNLASDIPQSKRDMLFHKDYLHISVGGNKRACIHWGLSPQRIKLVSLYFNQPFPKFKKQLRLYHVTGVQFDGYNALGFHEMIVRNVEGSLNIEGLKAGYSYCVELGIVLKRNKFFPLLRSNTQKIPGVGTEIIDTFTEMGTDSENSMPNWAQAVSTYTLYDNLNNGWLKG